MDKIRFSAFLKDALSVDIFRRSWDCNSDPTFRPLVTAVVSLEDPVHQSPSSHQVLGQRLATERRSEILSSVLQRAVPERIIRALSRTDWPKYEAADWQLFFHILLENPDSSALNHVAEVTPTLLHQYAHVPRELRNTKLLSVLNDLTVPPELWKRLHADLLAIPKQRRISLIGQAAAIHTAGDFWDYVMRVEGRASRPFGIPSSFRCSPLLEALDTPKRMIEEGHRMNNCLGRFVSRAITLNRVFFCSRTAAMVTAELQLKRGRWVPGKIEGPSNTPLDPTLDSLIRIELTRLAETDRRQPPWESVDPSMPTLRQIAKIGRSHFSVDELAECRQAIASIIGRSLSDTNGAFTIFELERGPYVQFLASPDGKELFMEISSHHYVDSVSAYLTASMVDLLDGAGILWPIGEQNFRRWFSATDPKSVTLIAELSLGILHTFFNHQSGDELEIKTHIPVVEP